LKDNGYIEKIKRKDYLQDLEILKVRNLVDEKISKIIEFNKEKNIVLNYSLLQNSFYFIRCNTIISVNNNEIAELNSGLEALVNGADNENSHIEINTSTEWESKLTKYMDYNFFHDKKVSVVVPIYNTSKYLIKCVKSIMQQTYRNLEIILIDDGSTDDSLKICNMLATMDSRIKVIHQDNVGLAETRNNGIDLSTGDYICFFDSDDFIDKDMIETLLINAERTNSDVSSVRAHVHLRNGNVVGYGKQDREIKTYKGLLNVVNGYSDGDISIAVWDKMFKKEALEGIRFDPKVFKEDVDFTLKLCMANKSFVTDTKEFYHYVKRTSNSITSKFNTKCFQLQEWAYQAYFNILSLGEDYRDAAEKCLFNSLTHIIKTYLRDLHRGIVKETEYRDEIQLVTNNIMSLLLNTDNVTKFDDLDNDLNIINELIERQVVNKEKLPTIDVRCIGILWNSLNEELMNEAISIIQNKSSIEEWQYIDLEEEYRSFINDIYFHNREFEGIPYLKACGLIDQYDSNKIVILNLLVKVSGIIYDKMKGYMFKEIAQLKKEIRKEFKCRIRNYAYDNIFHLTVDEEEYEYTDGIVRKYVKGFGEENHEKK